MDVLDRHRWRNPNVHLQTRMVGNHVGLDAARDSAERYLRTPKQRVAMRERIDSPLHLDNEFRGGPDGVHADLRISRMRKLAVGLDLDPDKPLLRDDDLEIGRLD